MHLHSCREKNQNTKTAAWTVQGKRECRWSHHKTHDWCNCKTITVTVDLQYLVSLNCFKVSSHSGQCCHARFCHLWPLWWSSCIPRPLFLSGSCQIFTDTVKKKKSASRQRVLTISLSLSKHHQTGKQYGYRTCPSRHFSGALEVMDQQYCSGATSFQPPLSLSLPLSRLWISPRSSLATVALSVLGCLSFTRERLSLQWQNGGKNR